MKLNVFLDNETHSVDIPDHILNEAEEFFQKMDRDMERGWQMGREWVESPTATHKCQIAADKLLTALETDNKAMMLLMAGYIVSRYPRATGVQIDTSGEMQNTQLIY